MWQKKQQPSFFTEQFDRLVTESDKFRIIKENIDFSFINELAKPLYGETGPLGYVPDKLFRMLVVMYLENIPSERKLEERLRYDIRYRYFCDLDIIDTIPDHATFSVFRSRLGDELFKEIFNRLTEMVLSLGFKRPKHLSIDSTSVIADCAVPRKARKAKNKNRAGGGGTGAQKPPADPDARWGVKSGRPTHFGYKQHLVVDSSTALILDATTTPANTADVEVAKKLLPRVLDNHPLADYLAADKAYNSPALREELAARKITSLIPLRRGGRKPATPRKVARKQGVENVDQKRRADAALFEKTEEFKLLYRLRGSVERVNAEAKRQHGLGRARYRCLNKVAIQGLLTVTAINLKRAAVYISSKAPPIEASMAVGG